MVGVRQGVGGLGVGAAWGRRCFRSHLYGGAERARRVHPVHGPAAVERVVVPHAAAESPQLYYH